MVTTKKTILAIDDDPGALEFLESRISRSLYHLDTAASLQAGLEYLSKKIPHALILDIQLGNENGFDLLRILKERGVVNRFPVLVHSSERDEVLISRAAEFNVAAYLLKPVNSETLHEKLASVIASASKFKQDFVSPAERSASASVSCEILHSNEVGLLLESQVKLAASSEVSVESSYLEDWKAENAYFRRTKRRSFLLENGKFLNEISVIGLDPGVILDIRRRSGE